VAVLENHPDRAGGLGRPRDRAQVADVGHAVERDQKPGALRLEQALEALLRVGVGEGTGPRRRAAGGGHGDAPLVRQGP
jgi:hypothetical protein